MSKIVSTHRPGEYTGGAQPGNRSSNDESCRTGSCSTDGGGNLKGQHAQEERVLDGEEEEQFPEQELDRAA